MMELFAAPAPTQHDYERWREEVPLEGRWLSRARLAASFIPPGSKVLDLGCGAMGLKRYLDPSCSYRGCDLFPRDEDTVICNFNYGEFPHEAAGHADVVTALGLIEYLTDIPWFIRQLASAPARLLIVTYHPTDMDPEKDWSQAKPWKQHMPLADFLGLLEGANLLASERREVSPVQLMFVIKR